MRELLCSVQQYWDVRAAEHFGGELWIQGIKALVSLVVPIMMSTANSGTKDCEEFCKELRRFIW